MPASAYLTSGREVPVVADTDVLIVGGGFPGVCAAIAAARLGVYVGYSDGDLSDDELGVIGGFFSALGCPPEFLDLVQEDITFFLDIQPRESAMRDACGALRAGGVSEAEMHSLFFMTCLVAYADGVVHDSERKALENIATRLRLDADHLSEALRSAKAVYTATYSKGDSPAVGEASHFETLGLSPNAPQAEIRSAYLELAQKYHPDKVEHLGDEFGKLAETRFKAIQAAYDALKTES